MASYHRVLMIGMEGAGKTTMLYRLKYGKIFHPKPTGGYNAQRFSIPGVACDVCFWDCGGSEKMVRLWKHLHDGDRTILFFINPLGTQKQYEAAVQGLEGIFENGVLPGTKVNVVYTHQDKKGCEGFSDYPVPELAYFGTEEARVCNVALAEEELGLTDFVDQLVAALPSEGLVEQLPRDVDPDDPQTFRCTCRCTCGYRPEPDPFARPGVEESEINV